MRVLSTIFLIVLGGAGAPLLGKYVHQSTNEVLYGFFTSAVIFIFFGVLAVRQGRKTFGVSPK